MSNVLQNVKEDCKKVFYYIRDNKIHNIPLRYAAGILVLFLIVLIIGIYSAIDKSCNDNITVEVKTGMQTEQIAELLKNKGIINHDVYFRFLAKIKGLDKDLKVGQYVLRKNMSDSDIMNTFLNGPQTVLVTVTIPEGYTAEKIADLLDKKGIVDRDAFLQAAETYVPYDYMENDDPNVKYKMEGYLFPDTYKFTTNASAKDVIDIMAGQFDKKLNSDLRAQADAMDISIHKLVVLASLVEAEAKFDDDRPIIAQVFFNRLNINMPLQSDTTIQYAMSERKENISIKDTKIDSPYNTYKNYGLPPGAVGNPGLSSIEAVLYPQQNDYLYFVADSQGHNHYSRTYEEHLEEVNSIE